ncbi:SspB family protein [Phreatobacter stygius]|uniref:Stringent starvation protein B n=2 Tax=Pseudomonadota TaxID=1224 RepID=A0A4D7AX67_9HYPH|nr:ClpXP protease specificity-enhancing factor SspB [Phreatobacter stygius]QCI65779.1 Stringent starvation protein B [Phreatobacter stygius]
MPTDLIRYDLLAQDALRGVVRRVLTDAVREGLPGDHHFYITFDTRAPGVRLSNRMREKYPQEMTVVLQHQFWDLSVTEHTFEVGLSFGGIPERLLVPFESIKGFFDPSVQFGLQFEVAGSGPDAAAVAPKELSAPATVEPPAPSAAAKPRGAARGAGSEPEEAGPAAEAEVKTDAAPPGGAEVVSLDKFRKK